MIILYILVTIYVCLNIKPLKESTYFYTKISYSTKNYVHMEKSIRIRRLNIVILKKHSDTRDIPFIELI